MEAAKGNASSVSKMEKEKKLMLQTDNRLNNTANLNRASNGKAVMITWSKWLKLI